MEDGGSLLAVASAVNCRFCAMEFGGHDGRLHSPSVEIPQLLV